MPFDIGRLEFTFSAKLSSPASLICNALSVIATSLSAQSTKLTRLLDIPASPIQAKSASSLLHVLRMRFSHCWISSKHTYDFPHRSPWMCYNCVSRICSLSLSHTLRRWSCFNYYCGAVQRFMSLIRTTMCLPVCEDEVNTWGFWYRFGKNCWAKNVFTDFLQTFTES